MPPKLRTLIFAPAQCDPLILVLISSIIILLNITNIKTDSDTGQLWPNKQLNVLIDSKSLNETEQQIIGASLEQIEQKTCVRINRLQANRVNPFGGQQNQLADREKDFIYLFRPHIGLYNRPPPVGLSTFGCAQKGRQSVVLTDAAFKFPELVLRYHLLRSLGVPNLTKPSESQLTQLESRQLPLSQKVVSLQNGTQNSGGGKLHEQTKLAPAALSGLEDMPPIYLAYATGPIDGAVQPPPRPSTGQPSRRYTPLADEDLAAIKQLYDCSDYQNRLSVKPPTVVTEQPASKSTSADSGEQQATSRAVDAAPTEPGDNSNGNGSGSSSSSLTAKKLRSAEESLKQIISAVAMEKGAQFDDELFGDTAKSIVHYLLSELEGVPVTNLSASRQDEQRLESLFESLNGAGGGGAKNHQERSTKERDQSSSLSGFGSFPAESGELERPMLLKLDPFHANDPQLKQANRMKLSQLNNSDSSSVVPQTYRLLNQTPAQQSLPFLDLYGGSQSQQQSAPAKGKSEMMISFEQTPDSKNPIAALASSQVLKLCSCTCQTMTPSGPSPSTLQPPQTLRPTSTELPDYPTYPTNPTYPTFPTATTPPSSKPATPPTLLPPWTTTDYPTYPTYTPTWPSIDPALTDETLTDSWTQWTQPSQKPTTTTTSKPPPTTKQPTTLDDDDETNTYSDTTFTYAPTVKPTTVPSVPPTTTQLPTTTPMTTTTTTPAPTTTTNNGTNNEGGGGDDWTACDQVQWVKPNKTIYSSAKIVWDVDRANQNYFLCNAQLDGELIPGKTHGLSCKVSSEGKAYEMHQFQVLIKPESVNLAWIQKDSKSFGSKNLPVIGGYSKSSGSGGGSNSSAYKGDPYVVSRCLVRDENNDVITLIGYINRQNVGWFPFDDIQIECAQYDVLACVN